MRSMRLSAIPPRRRRPGRRHVRVQVVRQAPVLGERDHVQRLGGGDVGDDDVQPHGQPRFGRGGDAPPERLAGAPPSDEPVVGRFGRAVQADHQAVQRQGGKQLQQVGAPQAGAVRGNRQHHAQLGRQPVVVREVLADSRLAAGDLKPDHPPSGRPAEAPSASTHGPGRAASAGTAIVRPRHSAVSPCLMPGGQALVIPGRASHAADARAVSDQAPGPISPGRRIRLFLTVRSDSCHILILPISSQHLIWKWVIPLAGHSFGYEAKFARKGTRSLMIWFASINSGIAAALFAVVVISIRACERRRDLFDRSHGGLPGAFTRKMLALHTQQTGPSARSRYQADARNLARR